MTVIKTLFRDDYIRKDGTAAVNIQLYLMRKRVVVYTGVSVCPDDWDYNKLMVKARHTNAESYNLMIEQARSLTNDILIKYHLRKIELTPAVFRSEYKNPTSYTDFYAWMLSEIKSRRGLIADSTFDMHVSILNSVKKFRKKLIFSEIDVDFIEKFEKFLKLQEKNSVNTISKKHRTIKSYLKRAQRKNLISKNPYNSIKIQKGKGRLIYLTEDELRKMINLYYKPFVLPHLKRTLRYFLFSCLTGLAIGDIKRLTFDDIINDTIVIVRKKRISAGGEPVKIPLSKSAKKLIKDTGKQRVIGIIFDCYSDQKTNRYIKDVAKYLKIKKDITYHVARHTFASLFLDKTNDLATLQKLLGHASITQTMIYAHVSEKKKRKQIKVFDNLI